MGLAIPRLVDRLDHDKRAQDALRRRRQRHALVLITRAGIPFLVGGGYALRRYVRNVRGTRDLDVFVRRRHARALLETLSAAGFETNLAFPHWLGKARIEGDWIDVIHSSGNGVAVVDDAWFTNAIPAVVLDLPVRLCPPEEMIWSKAFVMERERYDGADIAHLIRACHARLGWGRLVDRFGPHWRVLLSHLVLFGFIYPGERGCIPPAILAGLCRRLEHESWQPPSTQRLCQGTLLSREQYLTDVSRWGYVDGRLEPHGPMTAVDVTRWTAAIESEEEGNADRGGR